MHAVTVDDQASARLILEQFAIQSGLIRSCNGFATAAEAQQYLQQNKVDLVFLDIICRICPVFSFSRPSTIPR